MNRKLLVILLALGSLAGVYFSAVWLFETLLLPPPAHSAEANPAHLRIGEAFLDDLDAARYAEALERTTPAVREALDATKLKEIWETLPTQLGGRQSRSPLRGELVGDTPTVTSTLTFGLASLDARIVVDAEGRISGFRLVPAAAPATPAPTPASDAEFTEVEFITGQGALALGGTLTLPKGAGPFPAVLLVHGSGPHDRDETLGPNRPFRDIAHALAARGVASLRYDKRSKAHPQAFASGDFSVNEEVVDDAVRALGQLRADARIDAQRVFLAGHSLGAMMAPRIAQRVPELAGLILLAAPARPLQDLVAEQVRYLAARDGDVSTAEQGQIDAVTQKAAAVAAITPQTPAQDTLLGLPARYWIDLRDYDPVAVARGLPQPMLVVQGGRDYQVTPDGDFARWREAFAGEDRVQFALYPALNHLLIAGEGASGPEEYATAGRVDDAVIDDIAAFVGVAR